ncbi:alpha-N-acetylneuraminide alpha-2,8-sialyltransferase-like [Asterias amurensis]|uniref:alpha-N-acetylneuraminide alpha-2,8-sialyltransferase-like n=1 Tax=Asterias amurensis TaxID=7602 RepID=UPI003AB73491
MTRRLRACLLLLCSIVLLSIVYNVFYFTKKPPRMLQMTHLRQELIREITWGNTSFVFNADEHKQEGINTIIVRGITGNTEAIVRKSSIPGQFQVLKEIGDQLTFCDHVLTSTPWKPNPLNLAEFRMKLMNKTKSTFQDGFVLTHHNTRVGNTLPYTVDNYNLGSKTKFFNVTEGFFAENVSPNSPLSGKQFKRCSVVGNSGTLSNSSCGKEIDQSDYVIRMNLPILRPHMADAGWKTNLTTMNPTLVTRRFNGLKTKEGIDEYLNIIADFYGVLWLPCITATRTQDMCLKSKQTLDDYGVRNPESTIANPFHFDALLDFWKERTIKQFLTSGFYMTHLALTMCEETHLYGFWPFLYRVPDRVTDTGTNTLRKVKYHYFDEIGSSKAHSISDEFAVLLQMHVLGLLKLHVGDCDV